MTLFYLIKYLKPLKWWIKLYKKIVLVFTGATCCLDALTLNQDTGQATGSQPFLIHRLVKGQWGFVRPTTLPTLYCALQLMIKKLNCYQHF
jgi:hypothetical protein